MTVEPRANDIAFEVENQESYRWSQPEDPEAEVERWKKSLLPEILYPPAEILYPPPEALAFSLGVLVAGVLGLGVLVIGALGLGVLGRVWGVWLFGVRIPVAGVLVTGAGHVSVLL